MTQEQTFVGIAHQRKQYHQLLVHSGARSNVMLSADTLTLKTNPSYRFEFGGDARHREILPVALTLAKIPPMPAPGDSEIVFRLLLIHRCIRTGRGNDYSRRGRRTTGHTGCASLRKACTRNRRQCTWTTRDDTLHRDVTLNLVILGTYANRPLQHCETKRMTWILDFIPSIEHQSRSHPWLEDGTPIWKTDYYHGSALDLNPSIMELELGF